MKLIQPEYYPEKDFTMLPNRLINDKTISNKAIGVAAKLFSKPVDWVLWYNEMKSLKDGEKSLRSALNELEDAGWIQRHKKHDAQGKWDYTVILTNQKFNFKEPHGSEPQVAKSNVENNIKLPEGPKPHVSRTQVARTHVSKGGVINNNNTNREYINMNNNKIVSGDNKLSPHTQNQENSIKSKIDDNDFLDLGEDSIIGEI